MEESYFNAGDAVIFLRHSELRSGRLAMLFIHGLGESGRCFQEVFDDQRFHHLNLLVPDLAGYGRSSDSSDYSFEAHLSRLNELLDDIECGGVKLDQVIVVGHSMGADLATLLCASDRGRRVAAFVNIEGDLTEHELFISGRAVDADKSGRFDQWFKRDFTQSMISDDLAIRYASCRRYYESLKLARTAAFRENANELYRRATALPAPVRSEFGRLYLRLPIPRVYCFGEDSVSDPTRRFLADHGLETVLFPGAFHWPMIDKVDEFYAWLDDYIRSVL